MIVDYYRNHRIDVNAVQAPDGRWNAEVRTLRLFSQDKPHAEIVPCYKQTADPAEYSALIWARRWVDLHGAPEQ